MDYRQGPTTISPTGITTDTTPTFTWQAIDGAANYDLWVDNLSTGVKQVVRVTVPHVANAVNITYTRVATFPAGDYRWWVQAIAASGAKSNWSVGRDFTVPVPSIINPRGTLTSTNLPLFTWNGVTQYVKYDLWVNNLTTGTNQVIYQQNLTTKFYQTDLPLENGNFRAWVRGYDAVGNVSQWSGPADFTINVGTGNAPRALDPKGVVFDNTPTFNWQGTAGATTYEILVKRISSPDQPIVINVTGLTGTSYTTTVTLQPGQTYRWWIRGISSGGVAGPWSQPLDFRVASNDAETDSMPSHPESADEVIPAVLIVKSGSWESDDVISFTAHPAGTVIQLAPQPAVKIEAKTESAEEVAGIDSFMAEWAVDPSFFGASDNAEVTFTVPQPVAVPVAKTQSSDDDHRSLDLLMAGLLAGTVISRRRQSDEQDDRNIS